MPRIRHIIHLALVTSSITAMINRIRAISALTATAMIATMLAITLSAVPAVAQFAGGSGTAEDPYQIENVEQLQDVGQEEHRSSHFILVADIDASETAGWNDGKGFEPLRFDGHFDGGGHVITGLIIDRAQENEVGLFGFTYWDSVIKNLGLEDINITGGDLVGGLVGLNDHSVIQSCYVAGQVTGDRMVGGLIGALGIDGNPERYWVMSSYADVRVTGNNDVGGLIGGTALIWPLWGMMRSVYQSFAVGEVTGEKTVGGLMGYPKMAIIHDSYWDIEATGQSEGIADSIGTGFIGLTTDQMTGQNAFIYMNNLDFENTWQLTEGYPVLRWQEPEDAVEPPFAGGSGTEEDPWHVVTLEQLQKIGEREYRGRHFIQVAGIDASDTKNWNDGNGFEPISFSGSYDGNGYVISDLYINRKDESFVGLFSRLVGDARTGRTVEIRRLGLVDVDISGGNSVGGLAGFKNLARIASSFVTGHVTGESRIGGLIGHFEKSCDGSEPPPDKPPVILRSYTVVEVSGTEEVGGVAGSAAATYPTGIYYGCGGIHETYAFGRVSGEDMAGGWVGIMDDLRPQSANYWNKSHNEDLDAIGYYYYSGIAPNIIEGLTTDQMTGQNAYIHMYELDFVNTWQLTEGYPVLRWQEPEDAVDPPQVPIVRIDTTKRDFGVVSTDKSKTLEVPIRNTGNNMLNNEVYLAGPDAGMFVLADGLSTFSLEVDSSQTVAITFLPESLESYEAELRIVHDAPNRSDTLIIPLSGEGKEPTDARPDPGPDLPGELALHQNYPNPFNPSTVIAYQIPEESHVRLNVYDVTGRRVSRLVDEVQAPGEYRVTWNASEITSGIYIYQLSASGHTITRRMAQIR